MSAERPERCPRCDSPAPHLHPAMQHEGEVQPCSDAWHGPEATAHRIAVALQQEGYGARVWARGRHVRVYVTRALSRGRQEVGFIEVLPAGGLDFAGLTRCRAGIRNLLLGNLE